jgi:hypothetical protein
MKRLTAAAILVGLVILGQGKAYAIPILQLYMEGAHFDETTQSWVLIDHAGQGPVEFRLWAIATVRKPVGKGTVEDVRLSVAFSSKESGLSISLTPDYAAGAAYYEHFSDPSLPPDPLLTYPVNTSNGVWGDKPGEDGPVVMDGSTPVLYGGGSVPWHGTFGDGVYWQEFYLGDFDLADSPVTDFNNEFPASEWFDDAGQINAYTVSLSNWSGNIVYFDLYNHLAGANRGKFAPFSHDAHLATPEPASFIVWFLVGLSWAGSAWTHQYRRRWQKWQREEAMAAGSSPAEDQADRFARLGDDIEEWVALPTSSQFPGGADGPSARG